MHIHPILKPNLKPTTKLTTTLHLVLYIALIAMVALMLNGCSTSKKGSAKQEVQDGAPLHPKNVAHIPNAIPKDEPKSRYGNPATYTVFGKQYQVMDSSEGYSEKGTASWYGTKFHGRRTSSGEPYDLYAMTAAHKSLPLPTYVEVKNLENGKKIIVKVNDRGPFVDNRLIDLSFTAAKKLGVYERGTAKVKVTAINPKKWGKPKAPVDDLNQPDSNHPIFLQLGAFEDLSNAQRLASKAVALAQKNKIPLNIEHTEHSGKNWHKVRIGPIFDAKTANHLENQIMASNLPSPTIIQP